MAGRSRAIDTEVRQDIASNPAVILRSASSKHSGFTLIEISVVLVIIGLILGAVYKVTSASIEGAQINDTVALVNDLSTLTKEFKARYHYLPGDMPTAVAEIAGATANGNGDGLIQDGEKMLVSEHLFLAGFIKGGVGDAVLVAPFKTPFGRAWFISAALARSTSSPCNGGGASGVAVDNTAPSPNVQNLILLEGMPGDVAMAIDNKIDDGNYNGGNVRGSEAYSNFRISCLGIAS